MLCVLTQPEGAYCYQRAEGIISCASLCSASDSGVLAAAGDQKNTTRHFSSCISGFVGIMEQNSETQTFLTHSNALENLGCVEL